MFFGVKLPSLKKKYANVFLNAIKPLLLVIITWYVKQGKNVLNIYPHLTKLNCLFLIFIDLSTVLTAHILGDGPTFHEPFP